MKIVNLTPHSLNILDDKNNLVLSIPSSRIIARVQQSEEYEGLLDVVKDGIEYVVPVYSIEYGEIQGLPEEPEEDTLYIVSLVVAQALKEHSDWDVWKKHIAVPNTGPTRNGAVRDENGRIIGVRSLIVFK